MDRVVGISDRTSAALHTLALAACNGGTIAANVAAERLGLSPTYLAKILQNLVGKGIIASTRGIGGGFSLRRPACEMTCMEVLDALDGPLPSRYCLFEHAVCITKTCAFKPLCNDIEAKLKAALTTTTVADLSRSFAREGNA
ncbi:MAG: Rrf2 family transcriptional regulator [Spirochaetaceae bacterium]|nr:Rrf2 family transcriptional regulator [Spirochaetaceae bacterium]